MNHTINVRENNIILYVSKILKNYLLKMIKKLKKILAQKILQRKVGHARTPNDTGNSSSTRIKLFRKKREEGIKEKKNQKNNCVVHICACERVRVRKRKSVSHHNVLYVSSTMCLSTSTCKSSGPKNTKNKTVVSLSIIYGETAAN